MVIIFSPFTIGGHWLNINMISDLVKMIVMLTINVTMCKKNNSDYVVGNDVDEYEAANDVGRYYGDEIAVVNNYVDDTSSGRNVGIL